MILTEPYQPRLIDIQYMASQPDGAYWQSFGIEKLRPEPGQYEQLGNVWDLIVNMFNTKYRFRRIGQETMEQWQEVLTSVMLEYARDTDLALDLLEHNHTHKVTGSTETVAETVASSGTDTRTVSGSDKTRMNDTPYSGVNADAQYGASMEDSDHSGSDTMDYGKNDKRDYTLQKLDNSRIFADIAASVQAYDDPLRRFVSRFEVAFLQVFD